MLLDRGSYQIVNMASEGVVTERGRHLLAQLLEAMSTSDDKRKKNYSVEQLKLEQHLTYDALVDGQGNLITCSGLFNGGRYPAGVYRANNRVFVHPKYRVAHGKYPFYATDYLLPWQRAQYRDRIKTLFISREHPKSVGFLQKLAQRMDEPWVVSEHMVQVIPTSEEAPAYQCVVMLKDDWGSWSPKTMTFEHWLEKST